MNTKNIIINEEGSLGLYLKEIGKLKPLSSEYEAELARKIKQGDENALDTLVKANLRFVVSVARNYQNQGLSLCDLINEGNVGLVRAAKRFDEKKNFRFISYAVWWIRQAILQSLAEQSRIMRLPLNRAGAIHKIGKKQIELEQRFNRTPTLQEIAQELDISENIVQETLTISNSHVSLDAPIKDSDGATLLEVIRGNDHFEEDMFTVSLQDEIKKLLNTLSVREQEILRLYFGLESETAYTLDEIGKKFNITRERVRQIKSKALEKLKNSPDACLLKAIEV